MARMKARKLRARARLIARMEREFAEVCKGYTFEHGPSIENAFPVGKRIADGVVVKEVNGSIVTLDVTVKASVVSGGD